MKPRNSDETQEMIYQENWFDAKLLKSAGVVIGFLSPLFCWIVVSIFTINGEIAVQKEKLSLLSEVRMDLKIIRQDINNDLKIIRQDINNDLKIIRDDLSQLKIDVSIIKSQQKAP